MSNWGICSDNTSHNQCGNFPTPQNADDGLCFPYRVKMDCEVPPLPLPACPEEVFTTDYDPDNVDSPFKIFGQLFDQACNLITDQNGDFIATALS